MLHISIKFVNPTRMVYLRGNGGLGGYYRVYKDSFELKNIMDTLVYVCVCVCMCVFGSVLFIKGTNQHNKQAHHNSLIYIPHMYIKGIYIHVYTYSCIHVYENKQAQRHMTKQILKCCLPELFFLAFYQHQCRKS